MRARLAPNLASQPVFSGPEKASASFLVSGVIGSETVGYSLRIKCCGGGRAWETPQPSFEQPIEYRWHTNVRLRQLEPSPGGTAL